MAETRTSRSRTVVLSDESQNDHGFHVINETIDWTRYRTNPVLLKFHDRNQDPIGRITNIRRREDGLWVGDIVFSRTQRGRDAEMDWDDGNYNAVSINGLFRTIDRGGRRVTTYVEPREVSLVPVPSNRNALGDAVVSLSSVHFGIIGELETESEESLSSATLETIQKFEQTMETGENENVEIQSLETPEVTEVAAEKPAEVSLETPEDEKEESLATSNLSGFRRVLRALGFNMTINDASSNTTQVVSLAEDETKEEKPAEESLAAKEEEPAQKPDEKPEGETTEQSLESPEIEIPVVPTGHPVAETAKVFDLSTPINQKKSIMPTKPFLRAMEDEKFQRQFGIVASLASPDKEKDSGVANISLASTENIEAKEAIVSLASTMLADDGFMALVENVTFDVNGGKRESARTTIESLASGHLAQQYIENADLAKITWLSLFIRQLFPNNSWAARVRRVSVRDTEGILWIESAMNPEIYFGDRAPVNAKDYMYDDIPRGMARKVFALQPILYQPSNTDILSYNDRSTGMSEAMNIMSNAIHNYWLQSIAEDIPAANRLPMSGTSFNSAGRFPINPAAAGNLLGLSIRDIIGIQGRFLAQNLAFSNGSGVIVTAEPYFTELANSDDALSLLTRNLQSNQPGEMTIGGFQIGVRSMIAGYDTSTSTVVDAEMYFDKPVDWATGNIDESHVRPTLTATTYDIALAFRPEDILVGIGNTHVHVVSDPNSYGWKFSMDMSTAAGLLRRGGLGVAMFIPTAG